MPLGTVRVWRFGLYYFFVFGGFVALAQWLIPYYVNAYSMTVAMAGLLAAANSLPSGVIRAAGGWMSDSDRTTFQRHCRSVDNIDTTARSRVSGRTVVAHGDLGECCTVHSSRKDAAAHR
jgi:hypothetical protein